MGSMFLNPASAEESENPSVSQLLAGSLDTAVAALLLEALSRSVDQRRRTHAESFATSTVPVSSTANFTLVAPLDVLQSLRS